MATSLSSRTPKGLRRHFVSISRFQSSGIPSPFKEKTSSISLSALYAAESAARDKERGRWSKMLLFVPGAVTLGLGTWQILRRQEKIDMLDYRMRRLEMEPILWNQMLPAGHDLEPLEFRKVVCDGYFDESKSIFVGPRSRVISGVTENGFYVITPLIPTSSETGSLQPPVLVNRGWVPRSWRDRHQDYLENEKPSNVKTDHCMKNQESKWWKFWSTTTTSPKMMEPATAPLRVVGVVRGSEKPSIFVPANDPVNAQWFFVDVPMIARSCGLPEGTLYIEYINEEANATNPYPVPKDVNALIRHSVMPQDHLNYAITWYSLSAAVTFMAVKRIRPKKSRR